MMTGARNAPPRPRRAAAAEAAKQQAKRETEAAAGAAAKKRKLTNKERTELDALPKKSRCLRGNRRRLPAKLADPLFFKKPATEVTQATVRLHEIEALLATAYERWAELE
jgi:ATP-binding cassette subfamily F protein uup